MGLGGKYNRAWLRVILDIVRFWVNIDSKFTVNYRCFLNVIAHNDDLLTIYRDSQSVSTFIYDHRKFFRDLKQKTLNSMRESTVSGFDEKELYRFFRSEAFRHIDFIAK